MKRSLLSTAVAAASLSLISSVAMAGGLDRSGQDTSILHKEGNLFELTSVSVKPEVTGTYATALGGTATGDVAPDYSMTTVGFKMDVGDSLAVAFVNDSPYGAHVKWGAGALTGTEGKVSSDANTLMAAYKMDGGMSVYGGIKSQKIDVEASVAIPSTLGYSFAAASSSATGYLLGAAFEKPEIAMRVAFTYHPKVKHTISSVETLTVPMSATTTTNTSFYTPSAYNIDFQTGVAENTLLFGTIRKVNWTETDVAPSLYNTATSKSLLSYDEDTTNYSIGLGRKFSENWSAAVTYGYEGAGAGTGGPLSPTNGNSKYGLGVTYSAESFSATLAVQQINLGDQDVMVGAAANPMTDNKATVTAFKIAAKF